MRQKYCDHGRSSVVVAMTSPACRARSSCGSGAKPKKASILPSANNLSGLTLRSVTQWMSLAGVEPDLGGHQGQQVGLGRLNTHALPLQLGDAAEAFPWQTARNS